METTIEVIEPGVTPAVDMTLGPWDTFTDFEQQCGESRIWGGVHFRASLPAGQAIGTAIGDLVYGFVEAHIAGVAP